MYMYCPQFISNHFSFVIDRGLALALLRLHLALALLRVVGGRMPD